jgi:hypothetical protein
MDFTNYIGPKIPPTFAATGPAVSPVGEVQDALAGAPTATNWPGANTATYVPFLMQEHFTVDRLTVNVTSTGGNLDLGIYSEQRARLTASGVTAVAAAGVQTVDVANVTLAPGLYYVAMWASLTGAAFLGYNSTFTALRASGAAQETALASGLPATATFGSGFTTPVVIVTISSRAAV